MSEEITTEPRWRMLLLRGVLTMSAFVLVAVAGLVITLVSSARARVMAVQQTLEYMGVAPAQDEHGFTNILILGTGDENHDAPDLTDTMIIASIDPLHTRSAVLFSLPRDLYLETNRRLVNGRVNALYVNEKNRLQKVEGLSETGASLQALQTVAEEIGDKVGLPIHGVMKADFTAFTNVVDAIGGVDIVVEDDIVDYYYPVKEGVVGTFKIEAGPQHLDGETALKYARSRHSTSDFDRSARQQQLLTAIADTIRGMGRIDQIRFLLSLRSHLADHVETTMNNEELIGLAQIASELSFQSIITAQLNYSSGSDGQEASAGGFVFPPPKENYNGASVLLPIAGPSGLNDWSQIKTYLAFLTQKREQYLERPQIAIENLAAPSIQAFRFRNELLRYGWDVLSIETPEKKLPQPPVDSFVYYRSDDHQETAAMLGHMLSLPVAKATGNPTGTGDVLLMLGSGFKFQRFQSLSGAVLR